MIDLCERCSYPPIYGAKMVGNEFLCVSCAEIVEEILEREKREAEEIEATYRVTDELLAEYEMAEAV